MRSKVGRRLVKETPLLPPQSLLFFRFNSAGAHLVITIEPLPQVEFISLPMICFEPIISSVFLVLPHIRNELDWTSVPLAMNLYVLLIARFAQIFDTSFAMSLIAAICCPKFAGSLFRLLSPGSLTSQSRHSPVLISPISSPTSTPKLSATPFQVIGSSTASLLCSRWISSWPLRLPRRIGSSSSLDRGAQRCEAGVVPSEPINYAYQPNTFPNKLKVWKTSRQMLKDAPEAKKRKEKKLTTLRILKAGEIRE